jgi:hypothetical protein
VTIKLTGNWKGLTALLDRRTVPAIDQAVLTASVDVLKAAVMEGFANLKANAALTIMIKGGADPAVDADELRKAIRVIFLPRRRGLWIGLEASSPASRYAQIVADGASIPVTDAMRGMFFYLWLASEGRLDPGELTGAAAALWKRAPGGWLPLKDETTHIVIPPRPWMQNALARLQSSGKLTDVQQAAVTKALRSRFKGAR